MNKRARTDDDGIPAEILDVSSCEKDSTFFLEDGNIILLAGSTLFRIHKSVLSMHSQIFRDMFNVASGMLIHLYNLSRWFLRLFIRK